MNPDYCDIRPWPEYRPSYNPFAKQTKPKRTTKLRARAKRRKMKLHQRRNR